MRSSGLLGALSGKYQIELKVFNCLCAYFEALLSKNGSAGTMPLQEAERSRCGRG